MDPRCVRCIEFALVSKMNGSSIAVSYQSVPQHELEVCEQPGVDILVRVIRLGSMSARVPTVALRMNGV